MLARFELFNDQSFNQNNRQDLYTYLIFLIFRYALRKWHKTNATIRGILTALYTLKCTRDPLINRSLLCKNPRILQGDFQLYQYNNTTIQNSAFSKVFISFHYIWMFRYTEGRNCFIIFLANVL
jgi:hypothetical protein